MARGDVIAGRYRLDAEIGSGGMGEVWRATDVESAATVAQQPPGSVIPPRPTRAR